MVSTMNVMAQLVGDNQWGLRMFTSAMNVEKGRSYTLSFKYTST